MDIVILIFCLLLGFILIKSFKSIPDSHKTNLNKLLFFHFLIGIYYCFFTFGDSIGYWRRSMALNDNLFVSYISQKQGTYFMDALNYFPSKVIGLSYFSGMMLYTLLGFVGIIYFYVVCLNTIPNNSKFQGYYLFPLLFFLPNLHFWSVAIGKDTLLFLSIGMFSYGFLNPFRRLHLIIFALLIAYFVRPHITLFLIVSFGLAFVFGGKVSIGKRIFFSLLLIGVGIAILPTVMEYAKIEEATLDSFNNFSESKAALLSRSHTGSTVDISSSSYPLKVLTFLFRPLFFDVNGIPSLVCSFENLILLILCYIVVFKNNFWLTFKNAPFVIKGMIFFLIFGTLAFSQSLGNLGIMIRMRNMFLPGLLIFILWSFSYQQELKNKSRTLEDEI